MNKACTKNISLKNQFNFLLLAERHQNSNHAWLLVSPIGIRWYQEKVFNLLKSQASDFSRRDFVPKYFSRHFPTFSENKFLEQGLRFISIAQYTFLELKLVTFYFNDYFNFWIHTVILVVTFNEIMVIYCSNVQYGEHAFIYTSKVFNWNKKNLAYFPWVNINK